MRIRSFVVAYALILAILLFADRRPHPAPQNGYSHIIDLTAGQSAAAKSPAGKALAGDQTEIIAPGALIPGTWAAGEIPAERLIAPLIVMDLNAAPPAQLSLDDIAAWESRHGAVPQGAVIAIRRPTPAGARAATALPIGAAAAQFLMDARYTTGFAIETSPDFNSDRMLARQIALHGNYVIESAAHLTTLPASGSIIVVAPSKTKTAKRDQVRVLAMVR